jgi:flagellar FliL protein
MADPETPNAETEGSPPAPARGRARLLLALAGAVVLLLGGGGAGWYFFLRGEAKAVAKEAPTPAPQSVFKLGTVVVNVAGTQGRRYLRTTLELGAGAKDAKHLEEIRPALLDAAITVLSARPMDNLLRPEERDGLRGELRTRLSQAPGSRPVTHVFLTEFVVQ